MANTPQKDTPKTAEAAPTPPLRKGPPKPPSPPKPATINPGMLSNAAS